MEMKSSQQVIASLAKPTSQLMNTRPVWMNTEEVNE
jgi:hypothetical protein